MRTKQEKLNTKFHGWRWCLFHTACSIGYGDFSFATQTGRGLCTLYAVLAVIVTSRFVAGISAYIVNSKQEALVQKALRRRLRMFSKTISFLRFLY